MSENANVGKVFNVTGGGGGSGSLKLVSISVKIPPTKTTYKSGETFDPTGMVIEADYGFGLTSEVTGFSCAPTVLTDGTTAVTITYTENRVTKTTTQAVTVEKVLTGIAVTTNPTKMAYNYLEQFAPAGMVVTASFTDGSTQAVNGYTYPTSAFNTLGTNAVELSYTYEGVTETTSLNVTVNAIQLPLPAQSGTIEYDGTAKQPTWNANYDSSKMSFTGDTEGINAADDYTATFETIYGYVFPNGTRQADVTWAIDRQSIAAVPTQSNVLVADGTQKVPEWNGFVNGQLTKGGDLYGTEAGNYTMTFTPTANYKWWDGSTGAKDATWTITSVLVTIPSQKNVPTYSPGVSRTPEWDNFDETNSEVTVTAQTDAGDSYTATFHLLRGMWTDGTTADKTINWAIERATLSAVPTQANAASLKYDGNPKTPSWDSNYDSSKMTLDVTAQTLAGTNYSASFTPTANYKWFDGSTTAKTATWAIAKGDNTLTLSPTSLTLNASALTGSIYASRLGNGTITAESSDTSVATIGTINQTTGEIPINSVNNTNGNVTITVHVAAGDNYAACTDKTATVIASFAWLFGYDLTNSDSNPATRVSYPSGVDNAGFTAAKMNFGGSFSAGSWDLTPGETFMPRPCMLKFDGTVDYYLDPNDYTKKADGTASDVANVNYQGNAMMEWPKIYVKRTESNGVYSFRCSNEKLDSGYECWSNYDKNNNVIEHFYTPIYFGSKDTSGRMRSISGQTNWVFTSGAQPEIDAAKLNGSDIWYTEVVADRFLIQDLLVMIGKSTNGQETFGYGVCSASAAIAQGTMNTKGLFWGSNDKTSGVKVFGMENWWGNIWRRTAGWMLVSRQHKVKLTRGTKDGSTVADYNTDGSGYIVTGVSVPSSNGYISAMTTKAYGRLPSALSGSDSTYECDYLWENNATYYALCGGSWYDDLLGGPFSVVLYSAASTSYANYGAALSCKPLAAA